MPTTISMDGPWSLETVSTSKVYKTNRLTVVEAQHRDLHVSFAWCPCAAIAVAIAVAIAIAPETETEVGAETEAETETALAAEMAIEVAATCCSQL